MDTRLGEPLVSVGLPTFNRVASLRTAIESVLAQDYPNIELVISDNASTDGTQQLCEAYACSDARIRYHRQPHNRGATANFQEVLDRANGEFFMWLADDDWMDPSYVTVCSRVLLAEPDTVLVAGRVGYYEGSQQLSVEPPLTLDSDDPRQRVAGYFRRVGSNGTFYGVMRRSLLSAVPMRHCLGADWLMIASMAFFGKVHTVGEVMLHRSVDGVSQNVARLAAGFGLSRFFQRHARLYIAQTAFQDVAWHSSIYRPVGTFKRLVLAVRVFAILMLRFYVAVPMRNLRSSLEVWAAGTRRMLAPEQGSS